MRKARKTAGGGISLIQALEPRRLLSTAGSLDMSFGGSNTGKVSTDFSPASASGGDVAVQSDGKYVVVGGVGSDFLITRYNPNGTLDTSFGVTHSGKVDIHIGSGKGSFFANSVAIETNGDIVVGGYDTTGIDGDVVGIARLLPSGVSDMSFGSGGQITYSGFGGVQGRGGIAVQSDGKIIVAGDVNDGTILPTPSIALARFNVNGTLDKSFGDNGTQVASFGNIVFEGAIAIDTNGTASTNPYFGSIVVVGTEAFIHSQNTKFAVARFTSNGSLDKSFNGSGIAAPGFSNFAIGAGRSVMIEGDNSIVAGGDAAANADTSQDQPALVHYLANGKLDTSFGTNGGLATTNLGGFLQVVKIVPGFTGDIIAGVNSELAKHFAVAAFTPGGLLDTSFGSKGNTNVSFPDQGNLSSIAAAPNRHIIAVGGDTTVDVASLFDLAPKISVTSLDPTAGPATLEVVGHKGKFPITALVPNPASLIVSRDQRLPFATRVYFTIGGTANVPNLSDGKRGIDSYTLSGMTVQTTPLTSKIAYVDIPANQTFVTVTLSPENIPVSSTTATFTINSNALYDTAPPTAQTITILGTGTPPPPPPTTLTDTTDAYVQDGSEAADNFGTATQLEVKEGSSGFNRISYLKFDLSSLGTVNSVKLNLFGELNNSNATNIVTQLFSVSDTTWSETGITFNNKPALGSTVLGSVAVANTTPTMYTIDVTSYVKAQLAAGHKTVSFALKDPSGGSPFIGFNSKEAGSNAPTLTVT